MDHLPHGQDTLVERPLPHSLVGHQPITADYPHVDHPCSVLHEPRHNGMTERDVFANALLQIQLVGPQDASHLLDRILDLAIPSMVVGIRMLCHDLGQVVHSDPGLSHCVPQELQNCRFIVGP